MNHFIKSTVYKSKMKTVKSVINDMLLRSFMKQQRHLHHNVQSILDKMREIYFTETVGDKMVMYLSFEEFSALVILHNKIINYVQFNNSYFKDTYFDFYNGFFKDYTLHKNIFGYKMLELEPQIS